MPLQPGQLAPDFALRNLDGERRALGDLLPALLYFYKVECPTSALTLPVAQRLSAAYGGHVVGIAQDEPSDVLDFLTRLGGDFEQLLDDEPYAVSRAYSIVFTPTSFVVSADGTVLSTAEAWTRDGWNALSAALSRELKQPYVAASESDDGLPPMRPG